MHSDSDAPPMTESDPALSDTEAAAWAAIVESEWPDHSSEAAEPCDPIYLKVTTYVPSRPSIAMMLMEVGCLLCAAVVLVSRMASELGPGLHAATLKHQLSWMIPAVIAMAVLAALMSTRVCLFATYRLRRGAVRDVRGGAPDLGRTVRPPNPVSVICWIGTLVTAMLVAAWWVASGLEGRSTRVGSLIVLDHVAPVLIVALIVVIVCWLGITAWAARECRHRIRARSLCQPVVPV